MKNVSRAVTKMVEGISTGECPRGLGGCQGTSHHVKQANCFTFQLPLPHCSPFPKCSAFTPLTDLGVKTVTVKSLGI